MKRNLTTSVVMSTYNGGSYLSEQLSSLQLQGSSIDELIIVDDCSTDNTLDIIDGWRSRFSNTVVLSNEINHGWMANFRYALYNATKDIVFFCDQDDVWRSNKIDTFLHVFDNEPSIDVVVSPITQWDGTESVHDTSMVGGYSTDLSLELAGHVCREPFAGCCMAIRRTFAEKVSDVYKPSFAHDYFLQVCAVALGSLACLEEPSIYHRSHGENVTLQKRTKGSSIKGDVMRAESIAAALTLVSEGHCAGDIREVLERYRRGYSERAEYLESNGIKHLIKSFHSCREIYTPKSFIGDIGFATGLLRRS